MPALPGALTFTGPADAERLADALRAATGRVAFVAVDPGWTLPLYELALMTARWAHAGARGLEVVVITPEARPLGVFGAPAAAAVEEALAAQGIALRTASVATEVADGAVHLELEGPLPADLAVALPRLRGPALPGIPDAEHGFVAVDAFGRVEGAPGVFAVGDMTTRVMRQGGLAAQQAEAAASALAAETGADVTPVPYAPVLRGMLLTGAEPLYLRRDTTSPGAPRRPLNSSRSSGTSPFARLRRPRCPPRSPRPVPGDWPRSRGCGRGQSVHQAVTADRRRRLRSRS